MSANLILEVDSVRLSYGAMEVLKGVSLSVAEGETYAIIGPNGAGKTTLFKVMTGEVRCKQGTIRLKGEDVTHLPAYQRARRGFGRTFQMARVFLEMSVFENVVSSVESRFRTTGQSLGNWYSYKPSSLVADEADALLKDLGLLDLRGTEARFLSHGDKKRLEFALALAMKPAILMLDEPTAGMAQSDRMGIVELINRIRAERGITVVLTEHDMDVIFGLADRLMVLNYGEIIATGTVDEVRANPMVREVYLGKEMVGA